MNNIESVQIYESKLYEGYNCEWRDVLENWLFESPYFEDLKKRIDQISYVECDTYCIALYGKGLVGKGCMLKQAGAWLDRQGYTVLEFKGKSLDYSKLFEFMRSDSRNRYALLIEDASYYYKIIEQIFDKNDTNKKLLILTTSRNYNHIKKRYYLEGNPYEELEIKDKLDYKYAQIIYKKYLKKDTLENYQERRIKDVKKSPNIKYYLIYLQLLHMVKTFRNV